LRRLRSHLAMHWPMYLQLNLSSTAARRGNDRSDALARWLTPTPCHLTEQGNSLMNSWLPCRLPGSRTMAAANVGFLAMYPDSARTAQGSGA
jgi:hypothetical protein